MDTALSDRIKAFRKALGMSQTEFARAIGSVTGIRSEPPRQATISAWEDAEGSDPERGTLRLIADLAEPSYAVFEWLQYGGEIPVFRAVRPGDRRPEGGTGQQALEALEGVYRLATAFLSDLYRSGYVPMNRPIPWELVYETIGKVAALAAAELRRAGVSLDRVDPPVKANGSEGHS